MAIGWMTVLQSVPWSDVVRNAPKVAAGAKKLWQSARAAKTPGGAAEGEGESADAPVVTDPLGLLELQVRRLQADLGGAAKRLEASSDLINTLAEQNAQLIASVQSLSRRVAWLSLGLVLLAAGTALLYWR